MSEYWISTKKHYCEVCRCWLSGHSQNVKKHESSNRHISSLRNKMITSHKKKVEERRQKEFEAAEMERLNAITLDDPTPAEPSNKLPFMDSMFQYGPLVQPITDFESEKRRIEQAIHRKLQGIEEPQTVQKKDTRWIATIDQEDGTLIFCDRVTGLITKKRPKDFDGELPSQAYLTSNWVLKYDPNKRSKYYHNVQTNEVRWLDDPTPSIHTPITPLPNSITTTSTQKSGDTTVQSNREESTVKSEEKKDNIVINVKEEKKEDKKLIKVNLKPMNTSNNVEYHSNKVDDTGDKDDGIKKEDDNVVKKYDGPVIGQWEVVNPNESVFTHCTENEQLLSNNNSEFLHHDSNTLNYNFNRELYNENVEKPVYKKQTEYMESGLTIAKSKESRKVLDPNPNKIVENKINKLYAINSQHFTVYNGELEEILSLDYGKLLPDELLKIFEILSKNLYYNEKIFSLLFKSVLDKVVYFNTDELISLLTHINKISTFYYPSDSANSASDGTELILNSPTNPKPDAQKVIKRALEVLENKLKYKEEDFLSVNILSVVNKLTHFSCWNLSSYLSNSILNNIESNSSDTSNFSESLNIILDNCCLKIIDIICSNPQLTYGDNNSNLELFINKNLLLSYYSAGELSTLPLVINTVNNDQNSRGVSPLELDALCSIINRIYNILIKSEKLYNIESNCLNSSLQHVIPKLNFLNSKNQCYLILLLSQYVNNNTTNLDSSTEQIIKAVRTINRNISNQLNLSILDKLTKFGYVNHFTAKKFINSTLSQFPRNPIDSLLIQRTSSFSSKVFFNPFLNSPNNFKNDKFYCKFDINSVRTFGKSFSKGGILSRIRPFKCIPIYFYTCTT
uniref:Matrin-type domain-containing protein n=1 Tax=Theileria annulata TaxID=5874 RepID=A0A3B0NEN8_THEAN